MAAVNIVTSDTGWILERLARELEKRVPYVRYDAEVDPSAAIQYYLTYSRRQRRTSPIEVAYFAHMEEDQKTKELFFQVARSVEHCICHAELYAEVLRKDGIEHVTAISPGVDLDTFIPKVKIGVVGRTYHTGRKGERLVAQVMDVPGIDWFFTGEGWPGPALKIEPEALPDFYRSLDYVLVPALYEGGPMCVVEALACGTPVIAPPIGWVGEFPHIEYKTGNADDLRRVLQKVVRTKLKLRASVLDRTWDAWAEKHDRVFSSLLRASGHSPGRSLTAIDAAPRPRSVQLILHGGEGSSLGGPTVRVPGTARQLRELGLGAEVVRFPSAGIGQADLLHGFNIWSPKTSLAMARRAARSGKPFVFSPIFLDLSERQFWQDDLPSLFRREVDPKRIDATLVDLRAQHRTEMSLRRSIAEPQLGYHAMAREAVESANHVILLSEHEKGLLTRIGIHPRASTIIRNPVDAASFESSDPLLFEAEFGVRNFVLCVARVEPRKNQLMLVHALREAGVPIVLIGHVSSQNYADLIRVHGGGNVRFIDRLEPGSELLRSAYAAARVLVLPSWTEGAPLVALEGGAAGASMVLSDRSSEREYFGDLARYCDPSDPESIRSSVLEALETPIKHGQREMLKARVAHQFNWSRYARETLDVYHRTFAEFAASETSLRRNAPTSLRSDESAHGQTEIVVDVTTSANHRGRWTGIARVEMALAHALNACDDVHVHLVAWADESRRFVPVPLGALRPEFIASYVASMSARDNEEFRFPAGATFIVAGSGWMQNTRYAEGVANFAAERHLMLTPIVHDLIPLYFPFWFNDGYAPVFERNLAVLLSASARILAISDNTRRDIENFAAGRDLYLPEVKVFREGDCIEIPGVETPLSNDSKLAEIKALLGSAPFALSVGAIHTRKNHSLLYDVWVRLAGTLGNRCPHLILVGGVAWNGQEVARKIRADARINKLIHIVEDVDDTVLAWLYGKCLFTLYPSLYEGWGLPVGESLRFGKICIASKASSVPEIAPSLTDLIDPLDFRSWYTTILFYAGSETARMQREQTILNGYRPTSWLEVARNIIDLVRSPKGSAVAPNLCAPGDVIRLCELESAVLFKTLSWFATESWGAWSSGLRAGLRLVLSEPAVGPFALVVRARALVRSGTSLECGVLVNGQPIGRLEFCSSGPRTFSLFIPKELLGPDNVVSVVFENERLQRVSELTRASADRRNVGIGVEFISVLDLAFQNDLLPYLDDRERGWARQLIGPWIPILTTNARAELLRGEWIRTAWGMVATPRRSSLVLTLHEDPDADMIVECTVRAAATSTAPQSVLVLANGLPVASWQFLDDALCQREIRVPREIRRKQQPIVIEFVACQARTPAALAIGSETRSFVFGLFELRYGTQRLFERYLASAALLAPVYEVGREMSFRTTGVGESAMAAAPYLADGWLPAETRGTWTRGARGRLGLRLSCPARGGVLFDIALRTCGTRSLGPALAQVLVNDRPVLSVTLSSDNAHASTCLLPAESHAGRQDLTIEVASDRVTSPFALGDSKDDRLLGVQVSRLRLRTVGQFTLGEPLDLSDATIIDRIVAQNWHPPEPGGIWSNGRFGTLYIAVPEDFDPPNVRSDRPGKARDRDMQSAVRILAVARVLRGTRKQPTLLRIFVNAELCGEVTIESSECALIDIPMPVGLLKPGAILKVDLEQPSAASPKEQGVGEDDRLLGVFLSSLAIVSADKVMATVGLMPGIQSVPSHADMHEQRKTKKVAASTENASVGDGAERPSRARAIAEETVDLGEQPSVDGTGTIEPVVATSFADASGEGGGDASVPVVALSELVGFGAEAAVRPVMKGGWHGVEPMGIWSDGSPAGFVVQLRDVPRGGIRLGVLARVYGTNVTGPATVHVRANGELAGAWMFEGDEFRSEELAVPPSALRAGPVLEIEFERIGAISPQDAADSPDTRRLGIMLREMTISPASAGLETVTQAETDASYEKVYGLPNAPSADDLEPELAVPALLHGTEAARDASAHIKAPDGNAIRCETEASEVVLEKAHANAAHDLRHQGEIRSDSGALLDV